MDQQQGPATDSQARRPTSFIRRSAGFVWRHKTATLAIGGISYLLFQLRKKQLEARTPKIANGAVIGWTIKEGSIVEKHTSATHPRLGTAGKLLELLSGPKKDTTLLDALLGIEMAARDPRVSSIVVRLTDTQSTNHVNVGLGIAQIQELRKAVEKFNSSKRAQLGADAGRSYFYIDSFDDQATYYLASAFTDIVVQPSGVVPLTGISTTHTFHKALADRIGIEVQAEARKEYKGVVAPWTQTQMPEKQRENMMAVLHSLNDVLVEDIAAARSAAVLHSAATTDGDGISAAKIVRDAMLVGPLSAREAVDRGLASGIGFALDIPQLIGDRDVIAFSRYIAARRTELTKDRKNALSRNPNHAKLQKLVNEAGDLKNSLKSMDLLANMHPIKVGVVYLTGGIERFGPDGASGICKNLMAAAHDPTVSAIVMRIDSGGGDVIASETIGATVDYIQDRFGKPVVASYGNMSASGAYFASTTCARIFASPGTLTGSIGVAALRPVFTSKLLDFFGTRVEELYAVDNTSTSQFRRLEGAALERYQKTVDGIYESFTSRVAKGRSLTMDGVEAVAGGRVFTGAQAATNGLVDEIGGLTAAIETAAKMGHEKRVEIAKAMFTHHIDQAIRVASISANRCADNHDPSECKEALRNNNSEIKTRAMAIFESALESCSGPADAYKPDLLESIDVAVFPQEINITKRIIDWARGNNNNKKPADDAFGGDFGDGIVGSWAKRVVAESVRSAVVDEIEGLVGARAGGPAESVRLEENRPDFK